METIEQSIPDGHGKVHKPVRIPREEIDMSWSLPMTSGHLTERCEWRIAENYPTCPACLARRIEEIERDARTRRQSGDDMYWTEHRS